MYTIKVVAHSIVGDSLSENYTIDFSGKHASSVTLSEWTICVCGSMDLISAFIATNTNLCCVHVPAEVEAHSYIGVEVKEHSMYLLALLCSVAQFQQSQ